MRQGVDAKEGVRLKLLALPCPLTEGVGELVSKQRKLLVPNVSLSLSSSSSDEAGLKVLENDLGGVGAGEGGNIRAQFLGNVSTMAWTMPAKPTPIRVPCPPQGVHTPRLSYATCSSGIGTLCLGRSQSRALVHGRVCACGE